MEATQVGAIRRLLRLHLRQRLGQPLVVGDRAGLNGTDFIEPPDADGDRITQSARALTELNIDIICANIPQAKGRVERAFGTLQDRLVKDLRLANIASIAAANDWLAVFVADYNGSFGRAPAHDRDLDRPLCYETREPRTERSRR